MLTKIMTNLDAFYANFLFEYAKKHGITKRQAIEKAIQSLMNDYKNKQLETKYSQMMSDTQYIEEMRGNTQYLGYY